jgi:hypothetical protein
MYPLIPGEMMQSAVQMAVYFFTAVGAVLGLMMSIRA